MKASSIALLYVPGAATRPEVGGEGGGGASAVRSQCSDQAGGEGGEGDSITVKAPSIALLYVPGAATRPEVGGGRGRQVLEFAPLRGGSR